MNNKLHILFLCGWYPSRVLPNNGDFIQRHAKAVSSLNKISVLHIISDKNCIKEIEIVSEVLDGIQTHIGYIKKTNNPILKIYLYYKAFKLMLLKIGLIDVIHLNTLYPFGLLALHQKIIKKIPFIISEHWTGYHQPQASTLSFWRKLISKIIVRKAAFVCPVSNDLKNSLNIYMEIKKNVPLSANQNFAKQSQVHLNMEEYIYILKQKINLIIQI